MPIVPSRSTIRRVGARAAISLLAVTLLAACASAPPVSPQAAATAPTTAPTTAPATTSAASGSSGPTAAAPSGQKVNANTASVAELQRAFEAAGIANAARWAREVEEYRPYPTNDPTFAKLRGELAKYKPAAGVVDQIVATLSL